MREGKESGKWSSSEGHGSDEDEWGVEGWEDAGEAIMVPEQRGRGKEEGERERKGEERAEGCWDSELASNGV